MFLQLCY